MPGEFPPSPIKDMVPVPEVVISAPLKNIARSEEPAVPVAANEADRLILPPLAAITDFVPAELLISIATEPLSTQAMGLDNISINISNNILASVIDSSLIQPDAPIINYEKLEACLQAKHWQEADAETREILLKILIQHQMKYWLSLIVVK